MQVSATSAEGRGAIVRRGQSAQARDNDPQTGKRGFRRGRRDTGNWRKSAPAAS